MGWEIQKNIVCKLLTVFLLCVLLVLPSSLADRCASCDQKLNQQTREYLDDLPNQNEERTYLVKFKSSIDTDILSSVRVERELSRTDVAVVRSRAGAVENLLESSVVEFVELDQDVRVLSDTIPFGVMSTGAPFVWNQTNGSGVKIAILDTGISEHSDLSIAGGTSIVSADYIDYYGHGTAVAGVVAAVQDDSGIIGVAPASELYAVKVLNGPTGSLSDVIAGIEWATDNNMSVILMSLATSSYSEILRESLQDAYDSGIVLIAGSGNDGVYGISYPAGYNTVISVGAVDENNEHYDFSSYGFDLDVVAPGILINSTALNVGYRVYAGTSFSAAHVAGIVGLLLSYNSSISPQQARGKIINDAIDIGDSGREDFYGYGLATINLTTNNYTTPNSSYYYEVYNISNYGTPNETRVYWLNGTGSIDDVSFGEGYFKIYRYDGIFGHPFVLHVSNESTIILLAGVLDWLDDWNTEGTINDGKVWAGTGDEVTYFQFDDGAGVDAFCVDYELPLGYDKCWGRTSTKLQQCQDSYAFIDLMCDGGNCVSSGIDSFHSLPTGDFSSAERKTLTVVAYYDCDDSESFNSSIVHQNNRYYGHDAKKTVCTGTSTYRIDGRYPTDNWATIETHSCGSGRECFSQYENTTTSETRDFETLGSPYHPCRVIENGFCDNSSVCADGLTCVNGQCSSSTCNVNGRIDVLAEIDGGALSGGVIWLNNVSQTTTDGLGTARINLTGVDCDTDQEVQVRCSDNTTICGTKGTEIDYQGDVDTLVFECALACGGETDLFVSQDSVWVNVTGKKVTVTVWSVDKTTSGVKVNISRQDESGLIVESPALQTVSVTAGQGINATVTFSSLDADDFVHVWIDYTDVVTDESDETNNYLFRPAFKPVKAYLDISGESKFEDLNPLIEEYLSSYVDSVPLNEADIKISVSLVPDIVLLGDQRIVGPNGAITKPYGAVVERVSGSPPEVHVRGMGIEGILAGVKRLVNARDIFFVKESGNVTSYVDDLDQLGIGVQDLLSSQEAKTYFNQPESAGLQRVAEKILLDNNFEVAIKPVKTTSGTSYGQETILRVKNVNSDFSEEYRDAIGVNPLPVVFSAGLFGDLTRWENDDGLALQLAREGRDTWEIELMGGSTTDCSSCPNYTHEDLVDFYFPALMAGIQNYSGQQRMQFVGLSHGCRVGLDSYHNWSNGKNNSGYYFDFDTGQYVESHLASQFLDTFVGVGCVGAFDGNSDFTAIMIVRGDSAVNKLNQQGHISGGDVARTILSPFGPSSTGGKRISTNVFSKINDWIQGDEDQQPGDFTINNFGIVYAEFGTIFNHDLFIPENDAFGINETITAQNSTVKRIIAWHWDLPEMSRVRTAVRDILSGEAYK